ncbi:MAG: PfkB family carbohydrate kinase [Limnochordia bacterium]
MSVVPNRVLLFGAIFSGNSGVDAVYDVVALGELLIDFTPVGSSERGNPVFEANPGGAPTNVLACLAELGKGTGFIGKVGDDDFGRFLRQVLVDKGISTAGLVMDPAVPTTLAFVHLQPDGERSFSFYRNPGADTRLQPEELKEEMFSAQVFHFGSISLTHEPARSATLAALQLAQEKGMLISYDPNLRPPLWPDLDEARRQMLSVMGHVDIVKLSREELEFLTGSHDMESSSERLYRQYGLKLLLITLGKEGCFYRLGGLTGRVPGFNVKSIDATGAGDGFLGGILFQVLEQGTDLEKWTSDQISAAVRFANAVGALVTTQRGGIPAMPSLSAVRKLLQEQPLP